VYVTGLFHQIKGIAAVYGILNAIAMCNDYLQLKNVLTFFSEVPSERQTFIRDYRDGAFSPLAFWLSYTLIELLFDVISAVLMSVFVYWGNGLQIDPQKYFVFITIIAMLQFFGESLGIYSIISISTFSITSIRFYYVLSVWRPQCCKSMEHTECVSVRYVSWILQSQQNTSSSLSMAQLHLHSQVSIRIHSKFFI
jgi:hypothetical protein